ncbi:MAG: flagellar hook assembly protein FlgD [Treponema sp.]|nr:flagellar hook assembly protein FlgD [Treponema sp.]
MDGINTTMSAADKAAVDFAVTGYNKELGVKGRTVNHSLGKDDFLKLLIAQLQNQNPTNPVENTEFIAQMAQFSSLEQMTNMSTGFAKLANVFKASEAASMLGKTVELNIGDATTTGVVQAATREETPRVLVNGRYYTLDQIGAIYGN